MTPFRPAGAEASPELLPGSTWCRAGRVWARRLEAGSSDDVLDRVVAVLPSAPGDARETTCPVWLAQSQDSGSPGRSPQATLEKERGKTSNAHEEGDVRGSAATRDLLSDVLEESDGLANAARLTSKRSAGTSVDECRTEQSDRAETRCWELADLHRALCTQQALHEKQMREMLEVQEHRIVLAVKRAVAGRPPPSTSVPTGRQSWMRPSVQGDLTAEQGSPSTLLSSLPPRNLGAPPADHECASGTSDVEVLDGHGQLGRSATLATRPPSKKAMDRPSLNQLKPRLSRQMEALSEAKKEFERSNDRMNSHLNATKGGFAQCSRLLLMTRKFEIAVTSAIILNAIIIGVQVDWAMTRSECDLPGWLRVLEIMLSLFFLFELSIRCSGEGVCRFFSYGSNRNFYWNLFDVGLVLASVVEEVLGIVSEVNADLSGLRLFRIMRLVRMFRLVRVLRFFKDLRIMVAGILTSMHSMVWAVCILMFIMFVFAGIVLQFAAEEVFEQRKMAGGESLSEVEFRALMKYFGSLIRTIYTSFAAICGGVDWTDAAEPLLALHPLLGLLFCGYIAFAVLCVLNIITGVFVENATKMTTRDAEMVLMEELNSRTEWFKEVKSLFAATADTDGSGSLSADELAEKLKDPRMQAWFRKIGVQVESYSASGLFALLDFDGDGVIDLDEFAIALQQVHGTARSIDMAKITHDTKMMRRELNALKELSEMTLKGLANNGMVSDVYLNEFLPNDNRRSRSTICS